MRILAIESSCDETAAAIVEGEIPERAEELEKGKNTKKNKEIEKGEKVKERGSAKLKSNIVVSQIDIFKEYGGVIPEVAARSHLEAVLPVIDKAFSEAGLKLESGKNNWDEIDAVAVTNAPGLLGSLLVGTLTARTMAILHEKPLYPVHHLKSHIFSNWIEVETKPKFPLISLVISGGHTQIIRMEDEKSFEIIGTTLDDAVGECFDKVAKILGLEYPGGPSVSRAGADGDAEKYKLPHPKIEGLDFSFSGLKTAVLRAVQKEAKVPISYPSHELKNLLTEKQIADFSASFEKTAIEILLEKVEKALNLHPDTKSILFAGGVSSNENLRKMAEKTLNYASCDIFFPKREFSGDNAGMVGMAAYYEILSGKKPTDPRSLKVIPRSEIA